MIWSYFKQGPSFDLVSRLVDPRAVGGHEFINRAGILAVNNPKTSEAFRGVVNTG
jgi:hypothetical protein